MVTPENKFEELIIKVCSELSETLILKNREYGNSFSDSRKRFGLIHKDEKIPLVFHASEKISRYEIGGSEDSVFDLAGYAVLEIACRRETLD